jgi:hypothetical protein
VALGHDASEATPAVREAMAEAMAPWPSATVVDTSTATPAETLAAASVALGTSGR